MKKIIMVLGILLLCKTVYAVTEDASKLFIFGKKAYKVSIISSSVPMGSRDSALGIPTGIDAEGNFYYCTSDGNPNGLLWSIRKVDRLTGEISEVCHINFDSYKYGYIRAINFSADGQLYVWLALRKPTVRSWDEVLVRMTGFSKSGSD